MRQLTLASITARTLVTADPEAQPIKPGRWEVTPIDSSDQWAGADSGVIRPNHAASRQVMWLGKTLS